ncbi:AaceriADR210Cp [[Ashbya] aceris (nom. inval.)]|nr:AaceriADR210Cp [[Ashbya] aceris (nom. inval.)]
MAKRSEKTDGAKKTARGRGANEAAEGAEGAGARRYSLWNFWVASAALKLLLMPGYYSTDFEVHRNWLAVTHRLPVREWYVDATSQWTLDYPPLFAWFEWGLSQLVPAAVRRDGCLELVAEGRYGWPTVVFQRLTVIASEVLLYAVLQVYVNRSAPQERTVNFVVATSVALSPAFLLVDHIHFQYNGFLFAVLVASIVAARERRYLLCGACFTVALCLKHIFLYLAPAYFVFLLRAYVLDLGEFRFRSYRDLVFAVRWGNLCRLGGVVLAILFVTFAPFAGVMPQLLARLFPFSRGLTHAYWAPNFWAIYSFADKVLTFLMLRVPYVYKLATSLVQPPLIPASIDEIRARMAAGNHGTRGLVQDVSFVILPQIQPKLTFLLTLFYQVLAVLPVLFDPSFKRFIGSLALCGFSAFLFGWHVHEKAIMLVIVPFSFLVSFDQRLLTPFRLLTASGYVSLFPLLYSSSSFVIKVLYTLIWCIVYHSALKRTVPASASQQRRVFFFDRLAAVYVMLLLPMVLGVKYLELLEGKFEALEKYEFLGLMCYSIYCAIGVCTSWMGLSWLYNFDEPLWV